jgi:hypothetical protein
MAQCLIVDSSSSGSGARRLWWYGGLSLYAAAFLVYAETWAFTPDEGYHVLAAQLIAAGRIPYIDFCFPQTPLSASWAAVGGCRTCWRHYPPSVRSSTWRTMCGAASRLTDGAWREPP